MGYVWVFLTCRWQTSSDDVCYESVPVQKPEFLEGDDNVQTIDLILL